MVKERQHTNERVLIKRQTSNVNSWKMEYMMLPLLKFIVFIVLFNFLIYIKDLYWIKESGLGSLLSIENPQMIDRIVWDSEQEMRREAVKKAFLHAWNGYKKYSFGHDELRPCTNNSRDNFAGMGATIVDSIDTILLMGLNEEYPKCREFVQNIDFDKDEYVSVFEATIRFVGGLLSAYELTGDRLFLQKAEELAQRLLPAFRSVSGIPYSQVNLHTGAVRNNEWHKSDSILSEIGTIQLEFKHLSHHSGNPIYAQKAEHVMGILRNLHQAHKGKLVYGLYPNYLDTVSGLCRQDWYSLGALGDSFYEYCMLYFSIMII